MVKYREYTDESGTERVIAYSDKSMMIERDGKTYSEADDFAYQERKYTETDIPIEGDTDGEQAQKAAAFDYLTGRGVSDE
jgi:hypothetical protein